MHAVDTPHSIDSVDSVYTVDPVSSMAIFVLRDEWQRLLPVMLLLLMLWVLLLLLLRRWSMMRMLSQTQGMLRNDTCTGGLARRLHVYRLGNRRGRRYHGFVTLDLWGRHEALKLQHALGFLWQLQVRRYPQI